MFLFKQLLSLVSKRSATSKSSARSGTPLGMSRFSGPADDGLNEGVSGGQSFFTEPFRWRRRQLRQLQSIRISPPRPASASSCRYFSLSAHSEVPSKEQEEACMKSSNIEGRKCYGPFIYEIYPKDLSEDARQLSLRDDVYTSFLDLYTPDPDDRYDTIIYLLKNCGKNEQVIFYTEEKPNSYVSGGEGFPQMYWDKKESLKILKIIPILIIGCNGEKTYYSKAVFEGFRKLLLEYVQKTKSAEPTEEIKALLEAAKQATEISQKLTNGL